MNTNYHTNVTEKNGKYQAYIIENENDVIISRKIPNRVGIQFKFLILTNF